MTPTEKPHARWSRRLYWFHRAIWKLHARRFRRLAQYRFVHAVWLVPLLGLVDLAYDSAKYWPGWIIATAAWLSIVWRVPLHADAGDVHLSRPRAWWPSYDKAVSFGILVCSALTVFALIPIDSAAMPVRDFLRILRSALVEAAGCALVLSAIYYFFFGYLVGLLRLTWVWPRRVKRNRMQSMSSSRGERTPTWVTKSNLYLIVLLSILGLFLTDVWPLSASELALIVFIFALPITLFRSPWSGRHRRSLAAVLPHAYVVWTAGFVLHAAFLELFYREIGRHNIFFRVVSDGLGRLMPDGHQVHGWIAVVFVTLVLTAAVRLKGDLVPRDEGGVGAAALSIHGDAQMYVDRDGYSETLVNYILQSNGGVIGVTGLRGAGKTALLNRVKTKVGRRYAVVSMTAPVSHHEGFGFLMSVCRTICRQAIEEVSPILYGRTRAWQQALSEFVQRSRGFLAVILLILAAGWLGQSTLESPFLQAAGNRSALPAPERVRIGDEIARSFEGGYDFAPMFRRVVTAERRSIAGLATRISAALGEADDERTALPDGTRFAIAPIVSPGGFDLIRIHPVHDGRRRLVRRSDWIPESGWTPEYWNASGLYTFFILPTHPSGFNDAFERYWGLPLFPPRDPDVARFFRLQASFFRYVLGEGGLTFSVTSGVPFPENFPATVSNLQLLRGHPALEGHLEPEIAALKELLGVADPIIRNQELASIVIFSAFYRQIDSKISANLQEYLLTQPELRELHAILVRYLSLLDGRTLNEPKLPGPTTSSTNLNVAQSYWERIVSVAMSVWPFGALVVVLFFGGAVWRYGNFVIRAPINSSLLALVRASEDFLEFLDYSEGREASRGFSFRGLSFGARRILTSRALTLQSLTDHYLQYVRILRRHYNGKLVVVIDELDKVTDPRQIRDILLEIKGALFEEGCFYIISISEDAARAFRGRLSEGRDIFESSFDDIITIEHMPAETARLMVRRRLRTDPSLPAMDDASIDVLAMFSGGIPREIVRHLRESVMSRDGTANSAPRNIGLQVMRSEAEKWLSQVIEAPVSGEGLGEIRKNGNTILTRLQTLAECRSWPADIAALLNANLAILDPDNLRASVNLGSSRETLADIAGGRDGNGSADELRQLRRQMRWVAEVQTCIRLLVMNTVMVRVWNGAEDVWRPLVPDVIGCLRLVMQQPTLAENELSGIEGKLRSPKQDLRTAREWRGVPTPDRRSNSCTTR